MRVFDSCTSLRHSHTPNFMSTQLNLLHRRSGPLLLRLFPCPGSWGTLGCDASLHRASFSSAAAADGDHPAVMLVESPAKAKKIQDYLGPSYRVLASYGHIRDLPSKTGSVVLEDNFQMQWELMESARGRMKEIEDAVKNTPRLFLATDPDREGEAISWHLVQELEGRGALSNPQAAAAERITFTEVTKPAVLAALAAPRELSKPLVDAYMARRALDYLFGFTLSPLLWRKLPGARSAGRVQSVTLRLVSEREAALEAFTPMPYWTVHAQVALPGAESELVQATLVSIDGAPPPDPGFLAESVAQVATDRIAATEFSVSLSSSKEVSRNPSAPFTTSTLQQEASSRLGMGAARTMQYAQKLYEAGHITYMRTDGVSISEDALQGLRSAIEALHGTEYVAPTPRMYSSKAKNAQEAHEAIRPTDPLASPETLSTLGFEPAAVQLYRLIRSRALASQMSSARINQVTAEFESAQGDLKLRSTASHTTFLGYTAAYTWAAGAGGGGSGSGDAASADPDTINNNEETAEDAEGSSTTTKKTSSRQQQSLQREAAAAALAALQQGTPIALQEPSPTSHQTRGPPRFTEGSLVKALEELGVGRPSTYAPTMKLLQARRYVRKEGRALYAEPLGRVLSGFLSCYFPTYIDYEFTSRMEAALDEVSGGSTEWKDVLGGFWGPFKEAVASKSGLSGTEVIDALNKELEVLLFGDVPGTASHDKDASSSSISPSRHACPKCGKPLSLKLSHKGGPFVGCTGYPDCSFSRPINRDPEEERIMGSATERETGFGIAEKYGMRGSVRLLGTDPTTGKEVFIRQGPYGPYVQAGIDSDGEMRRAPLPKEIRAIGVELNYALSLLRLPRSLGDHPETGVPIEVRNGKYGPYVAYVNIRRAVPKDIDPLTLTLDEAVVMISAAATSRTRRSETAAKKKQNAAQAVDDAFGAPARKGRKAAGTLKVPKEKGEKKVKTVRARSAHQLFLKDNLGRYSSMPLKDRLKACNLEWKKLDEASVAKYQELAALDKQRVDVERAGLLQPGILWEKLPKEERTVLLRQLGDDGNAVVKVKVASGKAPQLKRPRNPYSLFLQAKSSEIRNAMPIDAVSGSFMQAVGLAWRALPTDERQIYIDKAELEQIAYRERRSALLKNASDAENVLKE